MMVSYLWVADVMCMCAVDTWLDGNRSAQYNSSKVLRYVAVKVVKCCQRKVKSGHANLHSCTYPRPTRRHTAKNPSGIPKMKPCRNTLVAEGFVLPHWCLGWYAWCG